MTALLIVSIGTVGACLIAFHFGRIAGAEEAEEKRAGREDTDAEVTAIACRECFKALADCRCARRAKWWA